MFNPILKIDQENQFWSNWGDRFVQIPNELFWAIGQKEITPLQFVLLAYFMSFDIQKKNPHTDSRNQIAKRFGLNIKTLRTALDGLVQKELIEIEQGEDYFRVHVLIKPVSKITKVKKDLSNVSIDLKIDEECDVIFEESTLSNDYAGGMVNFTMGGEGVWENLPPLEYYIGAEAHAPFQQKNLKENNLIYKSTQFDNAVNIYNIVEHWKSLGLHYESTPWEMNNLLKAAYVIKAHGADEQSILDAITAYSSEFKDQDSFYTFKHSIFSFFGSKGAWEKFLKGNYIKGQYSKNALKTLSEEDQQKRIKELADGINEFNGI